MLVEAILVHGVIGYKFYWLLPSEDQNQGTPAGHESPTKPCIQLPHGDGMLCHRLGNKETSQEWSCKLFYMPIVNQGAWQTNLHCFPMAFEK